MKKIEEQLVKKDIIVINSMGESRKKNTSRKVKSIYTIFNNYTKKTSKFSIGEFDRRRKVISETKIWQGFR